MRFYYENSYGDNGYFSEKDLIKAIYTAWNIDAELWLLNDGIKKLDKHQRVINQAKIVFAPLDDNELNSDLLKEYGYYMIDGDEVREIRKINTGEIVKYDWAEIKQLI